VQQFAAEFERQHPQLHVLVNNAAAMVLPTASTTAEGYELQFGVNFLDHFALSGRLYPLLHATPEARVVTVSSMGYLGGCLDFANLRLEKGYDGLREYRQSKLANLLFALELQRRLAATDGQVQSLAAQPGANRTSWAVNSAEYLAAAEKRWGGPAMEPWQGALTMLYAAPEASGGKLYSPDQNGGFRATPLKL
jgi:NAD(P)-dependent dehydrogenase (short-subunit alcohol dehydrogenase family)